MLLWSNFGTAREQRQSTFGKLEYGSNEGSAQRLRPHLIRSSPKVLAVLGANCFTPSRPFGCLRLHSARASSSCAFHRSGVGLTRGPIMNGFAELD